MTAATEGLRGRYIPPHSLFDEAALIATIDRLAAIESPTFHREGVNAAMTEAGRELARLGSTLRRVPGRDGLGDALIGRFSGQTPGILLLGHLDTVHAVGSTSSTMPIRRVDDRLFGPGVFDMKGGVAMALHALAVLQAAGRRSQLAVSVLLIPDEEIGSPTTRDLIESEARRHRYILVPEPAQEHGDLITGRWAFQRFRVTARGVPAHAGARLTAGRSAIREIADQIPRIEALSDPTKNVLCSVGVVHGGTFVNVVTPECTAEVLAVTEAPGDYDRVRAALLGLRSLRREVELVVEPGPVRPLWEPGGESLAVYALARDLATEIGYRPGSGVVGGGSDGNFTGALGVPTLDGLGPCGDGFHAPSEHLLIPSLVPRARLIAALLASLT